jgi:hypothetical protein
MRTSVARRISKPAATMTPPPPAGPGNSVGVRTRLVHVGGRRRCPRRVLPPSRSAGSADTSDPASAPTFTCSSRSLPAPKANLPIISDRPDATRSDRSWPGRPCRRARAGSLVPAAHQGTSAERPALVPPPGLMASIDPVGNSHVVRALVLQCAVKTPSGSGRVRGSTASRRPPRGDADRTCVRPLLAWLRASGPRRGRPQPGRTSFADVPGSCLHVHAVAVQQSCPRPARPRNRRACCAG